MAEKEVTNETKKKRFRKLINYLKELNEKEPERFDLDDFVMPTGSEGGANVCPVMEEAIKELQPMYVNIQEVILEGMEF